MGRESTGVGGVCAASFSRTCSSTHACGAHEKRGACDTLAVERPHKGAARGSEAEKTCSGPDRHDPVRRTHQFQLLRCQLKKRGQNGNEAPPLCCTRWEGQETQLVEHRGGAGRDNAQSFEGWASRALRQSSEWPQAPSRRLAHPHPTPHTPHPSPTRGLTYRTHSPTHTHSHSQRCFSGTPC